MQRWSFRREHAGALLRFGPQPDPCHPLDFCVIGPSETAMERKKGVTPGVSAASVREGADRDEGAAAAGVSGVWHAEASGRGKLFHSSPSRSLPPDFGRAPPHCLKKNATPSRMQMSRSLRAHSGCISRMTPHRSIHAYRPCSPDCCKSELIPNQISNHR